MIDNHPILEGRRDPVAEAGFRAARDFAEAIRQTTDTAEQLPDGVAAICDVCGRHFAELWRFQVHQLYSLCCGTHTDIFTTRALMEREGLRYT